MPSAAITRAPLLPDGAEATAPRTHTSVQRIDPGFFRTSGLAILAGRGDVTDLPTSPVESAVVNERAARQFWGTTDVLGRRFSLGESRPLEVAGVVQDDGMEPRVFRELRDGELTAATALVRTSQPSRTIVGPLRSVLSSLAPDRAFVRVATLRETSLGPLERITRMALAVAALVLTLATVGLYGSIAFVTSQRTREIAIRMAIGAPRPAVLRLVAREGVLVVGIGSILGLMLVGVAFQFMSGMFFAEWKLEPVTILGVLAVFSAATLGASYLPARRAMRLDPMSVLRSD
jgi:hypothetical protein